MSAAMLTPCLSPHFSLREMVESSTARRDPELWRRQCEPPASVRANLHRLMNRTLEPLRGLVGGWPILVNSGYRCGPLNRRIRGAARSQHILGQAADIRLASGWRLDPDGRHRGLVERVERRLGAEAIRDHAPNWWLFAAAAAHLDLCRVDQLIHEFGDWGAPAWVHVSHGPRQRGTVLAIGDWTDRRYLVLDIHRSESSREETQ